MSLDNITQADTAAIVDLSLLLRTMRPQLNEGVWVFAALPHGDNADILQPLATFREHEAITVIVPEAIALRAGLAIMFHSAWITLQVHSDLQAVGLTAAVAQALTAQGISCNVVAAAFHDHLFVPVERAQDAMQALQALQASAAAQTTQSR